MRSRELRSPGLLDDAMGNLAKSIMEGMSQMVTTLSTFWVSMPTVNLASPGRDHAKPRRRGASTANCGLDSGAGGPRRSFSAASG